jgi:transcription initiation factor TFIIIB Brf1 subunit/transcription initiation factor TFIIB
VIVIKLATHDKSQLSKVEICTSLICDVCNSTNIVQNEFGFVCKDCGVMLPIQILQYHRPYNEDILQYATLGKTKIGFKRERLRNPQSYRLERLNRIDSIKSNDENVEIKAIVEIGRIFEALSLPATDKSKILKNFKQIYKKLGQGTKYRSPEKLVPIVIYFTYKYECKPVDERALLDIAKISKKDFQAFKLQINEFMPEYKERNRKEYILQRIMEITEHFGLGMYFYYQSKKILYRLWGSIKNTKDDVIVGLTTSISALCLPKSPITVSDICNRLNIRMSTIHKQVEKKIFDRLRIPGFKSLVRSADLLKKVMERLGVLLNQFKECKEEAPEIIEIELGNAMQIFNPHDNVEYYFYALRDLENNTMFISYEVNKNAVKNLFEENFLTSKVNKEPTVINDQLFDLGIWKVKGPPQFKGNLVI